jgi:hypothetical protein
VSKIYHVRGPKGSRRAFLALPTYDSKLNGPCLHSLLKSLPALVDAGYGYDVYVLGGNCHVDDARNACVREFLLTDCTDLVFIDSDVGWQPDALVSIIGYDRDLVAGVYPKKSEEEDYPVHVYPDSDLVSDELGLVSVMGAPTGFMKLSRSMIEQMVASKSSKQHFGTNPDDPNKDVPYTVLFERTFNQGYRLSGDYAFCFKWREMGGKVLVNPNWYFVHEGQKEYGGGTLGDYWKRKFGVYKQEIVRAIESGLITYELFKMLFLSVNNPWAAPPELLWSVYHSALNVKGTTLETGSGLSTVALALAAKETGNQVISLEHDMTFMTHTADLLRRFNLSGFVDLRYAPIKNYGAFEWYDVEDIPNIAMALCDGPPRKFGRAGLFEVLKDQISNALIIADDMDDPKELAHLTAWSAANDRKMEPLGTRFAISMRAMQ